MMNIPAMKERDGSIGLKDSEETSSAHLPDMGFIFHLSIARGKTHNRSNKD